MHATMRSGQAEFALILGIVIIAVFVAIFAFSIQQTPGVDQSSLTSEQKAVETYVLDTIDRSADQILDYVYSQGGYVDPDAHTDVRFINQGGRKVAYWQMCDMLWTPADTEADMEDGMERLLKNTVPANIDIAGKQVTFSTQETNVDVTIYQEKIKFSVDIPVTIEGTAMNGPYEVEVQSRLGRIEEFASDFSYFQQRNRALDENLMKILRRSNPEDENWLPTEGIYMESAKTIKWSDLRTRMEEHILHMMTHTRMWEFPHLDAGGNAIEEWLDYLYIPQIEKSDGTWVQYPDLNVEFHYGGGENMLTRTSPEFMLMTDPDPLKLKYFVVPIPFDVKYDVSFPVLITVYDDYQKRSFRFLNFLNVRRNVAAQCNPQSMSVHAPDEYSLLCEQEQNMVRTVDVTVTALNGQPRGGVELALNGSCGLGMTFGDGKLSGFAAPDIQNAYLELYDGQTGAEHKVCLSPAPYLDGLSVYMPLPESFVLQLYVVDIERVGGRLVIRDVSTSISNGEKIDVKIVNRAGNACMDDIETILQGYNYVTVGEEDVIIVPIRKIEKMTTSADIRLPVTGSYYAEVSLTTTGLAGNVTAVGIPLTYGSFDVENGRNKIYIYAPKIINGFSESDVGTINALYTRCGIAPVSALDATDIKNPSVNPRGINPVGCFYP